jgi:hypothetical protein
MALSTRQGKHYYRCYALRIRGCSHIGNAMLHTKPNGADYAHSLPPDWLDRVLRFQPNGVVTPLVETLQAVAKRRGEAAIALEHVQELALTVCGLSGEYRLGAYTELFEVLTSAAGGSWPVTMPLDEQPLANKPVFDAAQRLIACDGEWCVLHAFIRSGWTPLQKKDRLGHDWVVTRGSRELPVEVKTKQTEGSDLGRFQFALRGLAMTPAGTFLNNHSWQWYGGQDLTRSGLAAFYDLLQSNLSEIERLLSSELPLYDQIDVAASTTASLSMQRQDPEQYPEQIALDFSFIDKMATAEVRAKNQITLVGHPNRYPGIYISGSAEARFTREADQTMLEDLERYVLNRLGIVEQATKRSPETLVVLMWEVPFHWTPDISAIQTRWREWCLKSSVRNGILSPIGPFAPRIMFATPSARELVPRDLSLARDEPPPD